jgi:HD-like signal output (HDOD) protein
MNKYEKIASQTSQLSSRLNEGKNIRLSFHYYNKDIIHFISSLFTKILSRKNIVFLQSTIITVLRELIVNAVKANSKRAYFRKKNLDMNNESEYSIGMESFKEYITRQQEQCEADLKEKKYKVALEIKHEQNGLNISVSNNVPMHPDELKKINERINKAKQYNDFSEVYGEVVDDSEGEGLGILLTVLFLRNSGIGENSLIYNSDKTHTVSTLKVPFELHPNEITTKIQKQIMDEVDELPTFPENIEKLQKMCRDPEVTIKKIAARIEIDPSLSASVLRLANSAGFIHRNRTEKLDDAIKIIGMKHLNSLLVASSARKIMEERYTSFKQIWNHCTQAASYSRILAEKLKLIKIIDNVFLAGLLHDLGKIVLLSTNSSLSEWISEVTRSRELRTSTVIEEVSIGISHSTIGEMIASKWNLPKYIVDSIKYHHSPLSAEGEYTDIIYLVYLANQLCGIESKKYSFEYIEEDVLQRYNITDIENFNRLHEAIKLKHEEQMKEE